MHFTKFCVIFLNLNLLENNIITDDGHCDQWVVLTIFGALRLILMFVANVYIALFTPIINDPS